MDEPKRLRKTKNRDEQIPKSKPMVDTKFIILIVMILVVFIVVVIAMIAVFALYKTKSDTDTDPAAEIPKPKPQHPMSHLEAYMKLTNPEQYAELRDRKEFIKNIGKLIDKELESKDLKKEMSDEELDREIREATEEANELEKREKEEEAKKILEQVDLDEDEFGEDI